MDLNLPTIQNYRHTMKKAGINPNKYPPSTEAMLKRVLKGSSLPTINALVDLCNAVSLENQIPLGGHDLRDIHEDLSIRFSKGTEDTKNVFFQLVGFEGGEGSQLIKALDSLEKLIVERFGGTYQRYLVNKSNPSIEF